MALGSGSKSDCSTWFCINAPRRVVGSGAAQAGHVVRIILRFAVSYSGLAALDSAACKTRFKRSHTRRAERSGQFAGIYNALREATAASSAGLSDRPPRRARTPSPPRPAPELRRVTSNEPAARSRQTPPTRRHASPCPTEAPYRRPCRSTGPRPRQCPPPRYKTRHSLYNPGNRPAA